MSGSLSIGDFARATQLTVKTLRNYHESGLLEPAEVDQHSGYRRYDLTQIPTAQVIRRFRALGMPLQDIRAVLAATDLATRNAVIAAHLRRLQHDLEQTQRAVATLRDLLEHTGSPAAVTHRAVPATTAAAVTETVTLDRAGQWYQGALGEVFATLAAQRIPPAGPAGGIYSTDLFADGRGTATVFAPVASPVAAVGRVRTLTIPAVELAVITHPGTHVDVDRSYGALATHVTQHALAVDGPVREYYLVDRHDTADESAWRTEIGWPIFATAPPVSSGA